jgi:hypothetical protein
VRLRTEDLSGAVGILTEALGTYWNLGQANASCG